MIEHTRDIRVAVEISAALDERRGDGLSIPAPFLILKSATSPPL